MNAQALSFSDLENLSDLEDVKPNFLQAQIKAAHRASVQRHTAQRYSRPVVAPQQKPEVTIQPDQTHNQVIAKLNEMAKRNSSFAMNVLSFYNRNEYLTDGHIRAVLKIITEDTDRAAARPAPVVTNSQIDLTNVPAGRYAVPNGDTRLKVLINKPAAPSKWIGFTFVSDAAEYGQRTNYGRQAPGKSYEGKIQDQLRIIASDPKAAAIAYGHLTGSCGICGRKLENEESVSLGMGPVCRDKQGW